MSYVRSTSSENRPIAWYALDNDVPPLKTTWSAKSDTNSAFNVHTTQTSFSSRCTGRPDRAAATSSASRRSAGESAKNASAMQDQRTDLLGHPRRQLSPGRRKLLERLSGERLSELAGHRTALPASEPRQRTNRISCRSSSERELPSRRVLEFNSLGTEV